ncbi:MAG TPA: hypothetical protein VHV78_02315 [Gemmatimonadaceae bacterium]|nr:hypothetical protein [Gemmatimonadaceae bacterium]
MLDALITAAPSALRTLDIDDNGTRTQLLIYVLLGFAVIIGLAVWGWLARRRRQRNIPATAPMPADVGAMRAEFDGFYVATTLDGQPLNRVAVRGLGFRARATIAVTDSGVVLALPGNNVFIPRDTIREVTRSNYTIDRVVEPGGLVLLAWILGRGTPTETRLDSYLRVTETEELVKAIASLLPTSTGPSTW